MNPSRTAAQPQQRREIPRQIAMPGVPARTPGLVRPQQEQRVLAGAGPADRRQLSLQW
jgi:hypothetical protein